MDIALVTCARLPEPDRDAAPLAQALDTAGLRWHWLPWDGPDHTELGRQPAHIDDGPAARMTIFRSPWNYPQYLHEFLAWAEARAQISNLYNPLAVVRWNAHKSYLLELHARGIDIAPTVLVPRGSQRTLADICAEQDWNDVVVKPAVSAGSFGTRRFSSLAHAAGEEHLRALAADRDVLVQRYLPSVEEYGERSLIWIDGAITHAIRKTPRFEGDAESVSPVAMDIATAEAALAEQALAAAMDMTGSSLLYARADMAPGRDGQPVLMELELIEPSLFFRQCPAALDRYIAAIRKRL